MGDELSPKEMSYQTSWYHVLRCTNAQNRLFPSHGCDKFDPKDINTTLVRTPHHKNAKTASNPQATTAGP